MLVVECARCARTNSVCRDNRVDIVETEVAMFELLLSRGRQNRVYQAAELLGG